MLFMPLGVAFGALGLGIPAAAGVGFGASVLIELVQTGVPGRYSTFGDIVANGSGAVIGLLLWHRFARGLPSLRVWSAVGAAALSATAVGTLPSPPGGLLYGQYTPRLGSFDAYDGEVLEALLGEGRLGSGPLSDTDEVRERLRHRDAIRVSFRVGTPTRGWAPVFAIFSADREEALFVGVRGDDVLLRVRSLAGALRFVEPSMVLYDGLAGFTPGDTAVVSARMERTGFCLETAFRSACGLGPDPLQGWRFLRRDLLVPLPWTWVSAALVAILSSMMLVSGGRGSAWAA
ncbi:MAG: VanZ family protein, partial [Longimicrobiales bacterium]